MNKFVIICRYTLLNNSAKFVFMFQASCIKETACTEKVTSVPLIVVYEHA